MEQSARSDAQSIPAASRGDLSSCGLCDVKKSFSSRAELYCHYSTGHFWKSLKQFINTKDKSCKICGHESEEITCLVRHVGATHEKVENFLDPALHVPKRQTVNQKSSDHECYLCQKQFSTRHLLKSHQSIRHFKEELKQFFDEEELQCNICHSKSSRLHHLMIHVGIVHRKLDEAMQQTKTPKQTSNKQALDQDLELSSDEDPGESEISPGDVVEDEEARESEFNREDYSVDNIEEEEEEEEKSNKGKHSRKRLKVSGFDDQGQDYSQVKKRKKFNHSKDGATCEAEEVPEVTKKEETEDKKQVTKEKEESMENSPSASDPSPVPSNPSLRLPDQSGLIVGVNTINYDVSFRNKTKTREERKMEMIMKSIAAMEKKEARKRNDSDKKGKPEKKRNSAEEGSGTRSDQPEAQEPGDSEYLEDIDFLLDSD